MNLEARITRLEQQTQDNNRSPFAQMIIYLPDYPGQPVELQRREVYVTAPDGRLQLATGDASIGPETKLYSGIDLRRV